MEHRAVRDCGAGRGLVAIQKQELLMRLLLFLGAAITLTAQPRIDNVLVRMVPPGATSLIGGNMDRIKATAFYSKLLNSQKMPQVDRFAEETGFAPRRDVRELLYV